MVVFLFGVPLKQPKKDDSHKDDIHISYGPLTWSAQNRGYPSKWLVSFGSLSNHKRLPDIIVGALVRLIGKKSFDNYLGGLFLVSGASTISFVNGQNFWTSRSRNS